MLTGKHNPSAFFQLSPTDNLLRGHAG